MIAQRLADRQNMSLVEGVVEGGAAMPRGAERHPLRRHRWIRLSGKIGRHQPRDIGQFRRVGDLAGERIYFGGHKDSSNDLHCVHSTGILCLKQGSFKLCCYEGETPTASSLRKQGPITTGISCCAKSSNSVFHN